MSFAKRQADLKDSDLRRRLEVLRKAIEQKHHLGFLSPRENVKPIVREKPQPLARAPGVKANG